MDTKSFKKYSFWIATSAVLVVFLTGWYLTTKKLKGDAEMFLGEIKASYSSVSAVVSSNPNHPNEFSHTMTKKLVDELRQNLLDAWELQYKRQEDVLVWPKELGDDFLADLDRLLIKDGQRHPVEAITYPSEEAQYNLQQHFLEQYQLFAETQVPPLADIIRSRWEADKTADEASEGGALPGFGGGQPNTQSQSLGPPAILTWGVQSQRNILSRFTWSSTPTTMQVLYAQEDLWVLNQIMVVLNEVNKDALVPSKAVITELVNLEVGRNAEGIQDVGKILSVADLKAAAFGGGGGDGDLGMDEGDMEDMEGMEEGMSTDSDSSSEGSTDGADTGTATAKAAPTHPAHHRYVDNTLNRLESERLQSAVQPGPQADLSTIYLAVAKRYPIRLRLKMNLTKLPDLLTACSNAKLPIEILQVSVNGSAGRSSSGGGGGGASAGEGMNEGMEGMEGMDMFGGGEEGGGGEGMDMFGGASQTTTERLILTNFPYEEEIELYGIVYIYNPVNNQKLGITPDQENVNGEMPAANEDAPAP